MGGPSGESRPTLLNSNRVQLFHSTTKENWTWGERNLSFLTYLQTSAAEQPLQVKPPLGIPRAESFLPGDTWATDPSR